MNKKYLITLSLLVTMVCSGFLSGIAVPERATGTSSHNQPDRLEINNEQQGFKWHNMSEGYKMAIKEKKMILVDVYTDWCGWCKVMDAKTYSDESVINKIGAHFVAVKFNPEISAEHIIGSDTLSSAQLLSYLNRGKHMPGYPMTYIWPVPSDQSSIAPYSGFIEAEPFSNMLSKYIGKHLD